MTDAPEPTLKLRAADLAARGFEDETIVLDLRSSTYLSTNASASVLWRELEQGATRARLIEALLEEFDVNEKRAGDDVDAFLEDCRRRDLLES
jgi:Coenzyme PQQ synthesis protein D (PqqD)